MKRGWILSLLGLVFAGILCFSGYHLATELLRAQEEKNAFTELAEIKNQREPQEIIRGQELETNEKESDVLLEHESDPESEQEQKTILDQYLPLYELNSDLFGWLCMDGTSVNYPVMYSPDRPDYYLNRAFDGSYSGSGVLFIDGRCPADGNYYIIYGHHMQNKTMFGQLPKYMDEEFRNEHPVFQFDTLYEHREYEIIAVFLSRIYDDNENNVFRYYEYTDLSDENIFTEYIREVKQAALYDTGISAEYGDDLLVLSTCNYHTADGRLVVVAKRIV
ncbi:MAG: class B sortase [Oscillospiraceae bacterium]|nr:class B sortase [Oscillospiraceae bacterium]